MNTETVARVVAALQKHDGLLTVTSAKQEGINKMALQRAVDLGVVKRYARNKYASPDVDPRKLVYRGAYLGQEAVLSLDGAFYYWALDGVKDLNLVWSIPHGGRASLPNVVRRRNFARLEVIEHNGILVTSVAQTLLDCAARMDIDVIERGYESALRKALLDDIEMREWVEAHSSWHGAPAMRAVLARRKPGERPTGSDVETMGLQLYRRERIEAVRQFRVDEPDGTLIGYADFWLPPTACLTEIDGLGTHDVANRQHDYDRQGRMEDVGYLVRRFTAEDVLYRSRYFIKRSLAARQAARWL